jgi:type II secretory pathway component PulF
MDIVEILIFLLKVLLLLSPVLVTWYGFVLFLFFRYRFMRQEELAYVLAAAAEANAPLAPALWAYLRDRPRDDWRTFWLIIIMFFVVPGYYFWWRRHNFESKVIRLATMLETGYSLQDSLRAARGVAPREVLLAAAVGESTGQLAAALRLAPRWRLTPVWMESAPRLLYPILLMLSVYGVFGFMLANIVPKYEKIFHDFHIKLPMLTDGVIHFGRMFYNNAAVPLGLLLPIAVMSTVALLLPSLRWYCPGIGRLYQMHVQSRLLRMLSLLVSEGRPLPLALDTLAESGYFRGLPRARVEEAQMRVEEGEPLADSLYRTGLLPRSMVGLVQTSERAQNLAWALSELGDSLARRAVRISERLSLALFPIIVTLVGVLVGVIALGLFYPLITLISEVGR